MPLLSLFSIENWSRSEEGRGGQQMSPELSNKVFSMNPHNTYIEISTESLMIPGFHRINEVCSS